MGTLHRRGALGARERGIEPVLVTARQEVDPALSDVEHHPILPPLFAGRLTTPRTLARAPRLRRILERCDVVHCIVELYAPLVALARQQILDLHYAMAGGAERCARLRGAAPPEGRRTGHRGSGALPATCD